MPVSGDTTVLVVDDVDANRCAMGAVLSRAGHRVVPLSSASAALVELDARLRAGALPDAAVVDVGLPDMDGFELCRRLKSHPGIAPMPVVHFSAASLTPRDRTRGLDAGAEAYLTVPVEPEEIQAVVRAALRGARLRHESAARAGRLSRLAEATATLHRARCPQELADAAAAAATLLTSGPVTAFVFAADTSLHVGGAPRWATAPDPSTLAALLRRAMAAGDGVRSVLAPAPLWPPEPFGRDGARLVLARGQADQPPVCLAVPARLPYGPETEALLSRLAQSLAVAAESLRTYAEERHIALTLQRSFLPQHVPRLPGADLAVRYVPASSRAEIGGDFYTALTTPAGLLVGVGDVVGHSLDAATVMVELRHALRAYATDVHEPAALIRRLDRMLQRYHPEATATLCLALIDPATGLARVASAGHLPPLLLPHRGGASFIDIRGPLLGLGLRHPPSTRLRLGPRDGLLMVTDGLIERRGADLADSLEQLRSAAAAAPAGTGALCDRLLDRFGDDREDDVALLALRLGAARGPSLPA
ncbi:fused response regulator/phosphatase [Streptomyces sp. SDr-06]|uniref:fused response regulator/phosphatase n=1 Tax=Streptomyces sp. SDr-06 TaxID=2267702 RepID=UPI000DEA1E4D|nr:fused response regulator/phosphatase [Streptomyces sp. SDr-06]RCH69465.1 fused response regulator/phosphatase [Streptomyces sp. SDr-06]